MASKQTLIVVAVIVLLIMGVVLVLSAIPTSFAYGGQPTTVCNLSLSVSGVYNDIAVGHFISSFAFDAGASGCHTQTLLDLFPNLPSFNLFPVTITFTVTLTNQQDGSVHGPYTITSTIPPLNYQYNFQSAATVSNVPKGTYSVNIVSDAPLGSIFGSTSYSTSISF